MTTKTPSQRKEAQDEAIAATLKNIKHRIIVLSGKGGVGKTTVSVNLASVLQSRGYETGLLDADVTGPNVPKMMGVSGSLHIHDGKIQPIMSNQVRVVSVANMVEEGQPVLWRGPMRSKLLHQVLADVAWGQLDFLVADLPPGTGDEVITLSQKMDPALAVIVTTPQDVSLIDSARAINMARKMNVPRIALIENMSGLLCPVCGARIDVFGKGGGKEQARQQNVTFLGELPLDVKVRIGADHGQPIARSCRDADVTLAMNKMVSSIEQMLRTTVS